MADKPDAGMPFHALAISVRLAGTINGEQFSGYALGFSLQGRDPVFLVVDQMSQNVVWARDDEVELATTAG